MRLSLSSKFALISTILVVIVAGSASFLMLNRFVDVWEQELMGQDRQLAQVLAGLRSREGNLDFKTIRHFVESADRVDTGLVYAIELDAQGSMRSGSLNPRLFASVDDSFKALVLHGRRYVLERLSMGKVDRRGKIKENKIPVPGGQLRLGFDLDRIDRQVIDTYKKGLAFILLALLVGVLGAFFVSRWLTSPIKNLAGAMDAVARGEIEQTVKVGTTDELAGMARAFNRMTRSLREQEWVQEHMARYLSPEVADRILREDNVLEMQAEERGVTVLVLGFRGFSTLSLGIASSAALKLLNEYLAPIIDAITEHQGVVSNLESSHLTAVWGLPRPVVDPELNAIRAAIAARTASSQESRRQAAVEGLQLEPCIGISAGRAVAGNLGSAKRVRYTVMGGAVEQARNIEQMARPGEILANEAAFSKVRDQVKATASAPLILDGMDEAVPLYKVERVI